MPQGARLFGLEPYYIRVAAGPQAPRRARLALVRRIRLQLAAGRRRRLEIWAWAVLAVWATCPLQTFLSGIDPALPAAAQSGTPLYRYARYATCAAALAIAVVRWERLLRLMRAGWPMLVLLAYALTSLVWSQDREASLKAVSTGAPTLLIALGMALALRPPRLLQALRLSLAICMVGSVLAVLLLPRYAVAGPHDLIGASAPGDWRGLYGHKNTLGHLAALAAALFATPAPRGRRWSRTLVIPLAAAAACLVGSRCMSGPLITATALGAAWMLGRSGALRAAAVGFGGAALALLFAVRALVLGAGLAVLGRDATFSGRTAIWREAMTLAGQRPLFGWGLDYAASPPVAQRLTQLFGVDHVHNAALDVYFSLGGVGVLLGVAALGWAVRPAATSAAAPALRSAILCWVLSGLTEDMGVRPEGPMAAMGLCALFGLYGVRSGRRRFRRPVFHFRPAWTAPLRPPRLRAAA